MEKPQNIKDVHYQLLKYCTTKFPFVKRIANELNVSDITVRRVFKIGVIKTPTQKAVLKAAEALLEEAKLTYPEIAKQIEEEAKNE